MKRNGSLLIVALVASAVVTILALALATWVRAQSGQLGGTHQREVALRMAANAAILAVADRLATDTNAWDAATEPWGREPWETLLDGWHLQVSALEPWEEDSTAAFTDECGKLPLNHADRSMLEALLRDGAGLSAERGRTLAAMIVDWRDADRLAFERPLNEADAYGTRDEPWEAPNRPFACVEELVLLPGVSDELLRRLAPLVTVEGEGGINLNTAPEMVLRALILSRSADDYAGGVNLLAALVAHRREGGVFHAADPAAIGQALGTLPADQAALLARLEPFMTVASSAFSGLARVRPATDASQAGSVGIAFVWDRKTGRFTRWIEP